MAESLVELATREGQNIIAQAITQSSSIFVANAGRSEAAADRAEEAMARAESAGSSSEAAKREAVESAEQATLIYNSFLQQYGYPFTAATAAAMTDSTKIYVYTGSETGYTNGNWYYYNGSAWVDGGVYNAIAFNTDPTLAISGAAADAKVTGEMLSNLNKVAFITNDMSVAATSSGWKLDPDTGLCTSDANYKLIEYTVTAGDYVKIVSDNYFQFQTVASVPSSGSSNRVGDTFGSGTFYKEVPSTATYLIISTTMNNSTAVVYKAQPISTPINNLIEVPITFNSGYYDNVQNKAKESSDYKYCKIDVSLYRGGLMVGTTAVTPNTPSLGLCFVDIKGEKIISYLNPNNNHFDFPYSVSVPSNAKYVYISLRIANENYWLKPSFDLTRVFPNIEPVIELPPKVNDLIGIPIVFNSGCYNPLYNRIDESTAYKYCKIDVSLYRGGLVVGETGITPNAPNAGIGFVDVDEKQLTSYINTNTGSFDFPYSLQVPSSAKYMYISLRIANEGFWKDPSFDLTKVFPNIESLFVPEDENLSTRLDNARHVPNETVVPLTLLHFSDLHADKSALERIITKAQKYASDIDGMICTGDMVQSTATQISDWWEEDVMTCMGNHDTASYSAEDGWDWTALSMADRDTYYITPFESNWGITHTSGTSYYYKDYTTQKVRLIVMDGQLYINAGADATTQTSWLSSLLADAITNDMHVLIAIHAPHGGSTAKECSFSRYGQTPRPVYSDSNTPQVVIDTVQTAINNGLHFVGYIVGHTHQDNIWDAENDGKQLMYCITCAAVDQKAQWTNSDQHRSNTEDAYNLVTIDTVNTLVKIVRGGGADIDDHMRTRKAICFNYTTGEIVGEVL